MSETGNGKGEGRPEGAGRPHTARFASRGPRTPQELCAFGSGLISDALGGRIDVSVGRLAARGAQVMISAANVGEKVGATTDLVGAAADPPPDPEELALLQRLEEIRRERQRA